MSEKLPEEQQFSLQEQVCANLFQQAKTDKAEPPMRPVLAHLEGHLKPGSAVLLFEPHADDAAIACGALAIDLAALGFRVIQICLYSGERSSGFPEEFSRDKRIQIRYRETQLASEWLNAEPLFLSLESYNQKHYQPTVNDRQRLLELMNEYQPGAVFCPPGTDRHPAHRAARALIAWALWATQTQCPIITYTTPWGLPYQHNGYHAFEKNTAFRKLRAVRAYTSQQGVNADYARYCHHLGRAWLGLFDQIACGPYFDPESDQGKAQLCGLELFRIEEYAPEHLTWDPIQTVLGSFQGQVTLDDSLLHTQQDQASALPGPISPSKRGKNAHTIR